VLRGFLTEEEVRPIEAIYDKFMKREITVPGKVRRHIAVTRVSSCSHAETVTSSLYPCTRTTGLRTFAT